MTTAGCPHQATNATHNSKTELIRKTPPQQSPLSSTQGRGRRKQLQKHSFLLRPLLAFILVWQLQKLSGSGCALAMPIATQKNDEAFARELTQSSAKSPASSDTSCELNLNTKHPAWINTCGGSWSPSEGSLQPVVKRCGQKKKIQRKLQNDIGREMRHLRELDRRSSSPSIDISKPAAWEKHLAAYAFLPIPREKTSQVRLRQLHKDLQIYVAAFSYFHHIQQHWDFENKQQRITPLSYHLDQLKHSAGEVLCYVETALNATNQLYASSRSSQSNKGGIHIWSLKKMEERLQLFKTPLLRPDDKESKPQREGVERQPNAIDLVILKLRYMKFLKNVTVQLKQERTKPCQSKKLPTKKPKSKPTQQQRKQEKRRKKVT